MHMGRCSIVVRVGNLTGNNEEDKLKRLISLAKFEKRNQKHTQNSPFHDLTDSRPPCRLSGLFLFLRRRIF